MGVNILNFPYRWDGVMAAYKKGYGVAAMNPLIGGAIPNHEKKLTFLASVGETPTEAALRFLISCPQISVVLNGLRFVNISIWPAVLPIKLYLLMTKI